MSTPEITFYQDENVLITNTRAVLGGKTYAMANITSVTTGVIPANRKPGIVVTIIGGLLTLCCLGGAITSIVMIFSQGEQVNNNILTVILCGVGALVSLLGLVAGVALAKRATPTYVVRLGSASGETNALTSKKQEYIAAIINAMNNAIIKRG